MERKRLFIAPKSGAKERAKIVKWAAVNNYDTLVFSLFDKFFKTGGLNNKAEYIKLAKHYKFNIEAGGNDLTSLLPRRLFLFHRDLFRLVQGKRKKHHHFCPTNPKTITRITKQAEFLFTRSLPSVTVPRIFHLLAARLNTHAPNRKASFQGSRLRYLPGPLSPYVVRPPSY